MNWVYVALVFLVIIFSICIVLFNENIYKSYDKSEWSNNVGVLSLLASISLILFGYACQLGIEYNKKIGPLLCLNLIFIIFWICSLTCIPSFDLTCISSWVVFIITLTIVILLGMIIFLDNHFC